MSEDTTTGTATGVTPGLTARIADGNIVISVAVAALPELLRMSQASGEIDDAFEVTDAAAFAEGVVVALNDEDEEGATHMHVLFDRAMAEAIENGAEGIAEKDEDEGAEPAAAGDDAEAMDETAAAPAAEPASTEAAPAEAAA